MKGMRLILGIVLVLAPFVSTFAQQTITWETLEDVTFQMKYDETIESNIELPVFGKSVKKLNGKDVIIKGYIVPVDMTSDYFVLSAFPFSQCFFCGNAGRETVMDMKLHDSDEFDALRVDQIITVRGKLRLNPVDIYQLTYILDDAEVIDID